MLVLIVFQISALLTSARLSGGRFTPTATRRAESLFSSRVVTANASLTTLSGPPECCTVAAQSQRRKSGNSRETVKMQKHSEGLSPGRLTGVAGNKNQCLLSGRTQKTPSQIHLSPSHKQRLRGRGDLLARETANLVQEPDLQHN